MLQKSEWAAIGFIGGLFFVMGPMMELVDIGLGESIHWPFLTYTFILAGSAVATIVLIAAKWDKRTLEKNQSKVVAGGFVFIMLYLSATVFK